MLTMTTQWPQQFQAPPNQIQNAYQHGYPQRQQYGTPQNGVYNHQHQPTAQAGPIQQQSQAGPGPNACYNCGAAEHWAQDCPEPRRENPAGLIHRPKNSRPFKRQKPNAPIITKYPVPSHVQQPNGPAPLYSSGQYTPPGYPPQRVPYGPPTPLSTQSPSKPQWQQSPSQAHWQQSPQYPHYQQPYQQNQYQHGGHYQQHSYPTPTAQTPSSYYSANNQGSPQGPPYGPNGYPQQTQLSQPQGFQAPALAAASPGPVSSASNGHPLNQYPEGNTLNSANAFQGPHHPNQVAQSYSVTAKPQMADLANNEIDEDNLSALDIPDLPPSSRNLTDQIILSGGALIRLFGRPLPANFVVADVILPLEPPQREDEGRCQSKYWVRSNSENLIQNIKETKAWLEFERDPIFAYNPDDNSVIPLNDLLAKGRHQRAEENLEDSEAKAGDRQQTPERKSREAWQVMDSLEHALNNGSDKQPGPASSISEQKCQPPKDTEQVLAALGVTGAPKPVRAPARPYPPPPLPEHGSSEQLSSSRSRSPIQHDTNGSYNRDSRSHSGVRIDQQSHDTNDSSSHPSYHSHTQTPLGEDLPDFNSNGSTEMQHKQKFGPPPPPPPPLRKQLSMNSSAPSDNHVEYENGPGRYTADGQPLTPSKVRSERLNGRKREYDSRDSSDESETPRRRQVDDVTPKLKRRQPKVDAAYSRRW